MGVVALSGLISLLGRRARVQRHEEMEDLGPPAIQSPSHSRGKRME